MSRLPQRLALVALAAVAVVAARPHLASPSATTSAGNPSAPVDFEFTDIDGKTAWLSDLRGHRATVVVVRDVGCPVSQRYGPKLGRLEQEFGARGVGFLYVNLNAADSVAGMREEMARFGLKGRYAHDPRGRIGRALRVHSTGDVFVFDSTRRLAYRGPVDDQYGVGWSKPAATREHLRASLDGVLAGRRGAPVAVQSSGCLLGFDKAPAPKRTALTYHGRVSRIIQDNCQTCHRTGGIAPFAMEKYQDVYARRQMIAWMTKTRRMPPWFAHRDVGEFANDRSLADDDLRDLLAWIDAGAPEGNAAQAPAPKRWATGWQIGTPDTVFTMKETFRVPAEGVVDYQYFYVKTDYPEDRWIERMEMIPGARKQVHHALVFIEEPGRKRAGDSTRSSGDPVFQGGGAGFFAGYVPGRQGTTFPAGAAKRLPRGAWLKFQMHYTTNGSEADDRTQLGVVWAKQPPKHEVVTRSAINTRFVIPPGAKGFPVSGTYTFREAGIVTGFFPHMHVRGAAFRVELVGADSTVTRQLEVPRYDFAWQLAYELKEPFRVTPGMRLRATGWFDNSRDNPGNPDPTKEVRHGEQSFDEMMIGYFDFIAAPKGTTTAAAAGPAAPTTVPARPR